MTNSLLFSQCSPHDRDWENSQQKCDFCEAHGLPCGPNVRYSEDPAVIQRRALVPEDAGTNERHLEEPTAWSAPNVPAPAIRRTGGRNEAPPNVSWVGNGREPFGSPAFEDLEEKAFLK